jgi:putative transposase
MPNYRRAWTGRCWFFTVSLLDRSSTILTERIDALREAVQWTLQRYPFHTDAFAVLPDHIHAVWTLPLDDSDFPIRWRMIKSRFARTIPKEGAVSRSRQARGERGIWQRRFWEHLIRSEQDYSRHVEYCYINPVKQSCVVCRTGHIHRFIATYAPASSRSIGRARSTSPANLASGLRRVTPYKSAAADLYG